tara:strand:+ start:3237 stop:4505 length:1269 start_codon:yes stop_codon:yes gene_type:complete
MIKFNFDINKSKNFFFLDVLVYLSIFSLLAGPALLNFSTILLVIIFFFYSLKKKLFFKFLIKYLYWILGLLLFFSINIYYSNLPQESMQRFFSIVRFIFLAICLIYLLKNFDNFEKNLSKCITFVLISIMISMVYQYYNGSIFGVTPFTNHGFGLSGFFKDEYISGSVISKLFFFSLPFINTFKKNQIFTLLYLLIGSGFVLLANQRTPIVMMISGLFLYICLTNIYSRKLKILIMFFLLIIGSLTIKYHDGIYQKVIVKTAIQFSTKSDETVIDSFKNTQWGAHFLTAIMISQDNKFFGSGLKMFRYVCSDIKYNKIDSKKKDFRCSTHPHNIYLELAAELGLIIMLICVVLLFYILIKFFVSIKLRNKNSIEYFTAFFILYWPLQITGSFFSSFNGFFYFFGIAIIIFNITKNEFNEKFN